MSVQEFNPQTDIEFERVVDVPKELVYRAWTDPEWIVKWFTPAPWKTVAAYTELEAGGAFDTTMESPEGEQYPSKGVFLELIPNEKIVFSDLMQKGFRPNEQGMFTAVITLKSTPTGGTIYHVQAMHITPQKRDEHEQMGFIDGWSKALEQMVEMIKNTK